ncbi:hypothetical protein Hanom_Chr11g00982481 [Helianthus anomalus]
MFSECRGSLETNRTGYTTFSSTECRGSLETNRTGYTTFSSMAYSTLEEVDIAQRDSLTSIECKT